MRLRRRDMKSLKGGKWLISIIDELRAAQIIFLLLLIAMKIVLIWTGTSDHSYLQGEITECLLSSTETTTKKTRDLESTTTTIHLSWTSPSMSQIILKPPIANFKEIGRTWVSTSRPYSGRSIRRIRRSEESHSEITFWTYQIKVFWILLPTAQIDQETRCFKNQIVQNPERGSQRSQTKKKRSQDTAAQYSD